MARFDISNIAKSSWITGWTATSVVGYASSADTGRVTLNYRMVKRQKLPTRITHFNELHAGPSIKLNTEDTGLSACIFLLSYKFSKKQCTSITDVSVQNWPHPCYEIRVHCSPSWWMIFNQWSIYSNLRMRRNLRLKLQHVYQKCS